MRFEPTRGGTRDQTLSKPAKGDYWLIGCRKCKKVHFYVPKLGPAHRGVETLRPNVSVPVHAHTHTHAHQHTHVRPPRQTCTCAHLHARTHTCAHAHTHTCTYTCVQAHLHTRTHTDLQKQQTMMRMMTIRRIPPRAANTPIRIRSTTRGRET